MYDLNIDGFMVEFELIQLAKWAEQVPANGIIVEAGSYKGRSSYAWAKSCDPTVSVYCLDRFYDDFENEFIANTKDIPNIIPIKCEIPYNMNSWVPQPIDVFFLDAAHENPADIDAINYFLPLIKKGGLICGHDYYPIERHTPDIIDNVRELEQRLNQPVFNPPGTSLWAFKV
jgi:predicted O-methyltransferase YrrM